jgi:hypothetical protein
MGCVIAAVTGACASRSSTPEPEAEPAGPGPLRGFYSAEGDGPYASLNFYDRTHYLAERSHCDGAGCIEQGEFLYDAQTSKLTLRHENGSIETLPVEAIPDPSAAETSPQAVHVLDQVVAATANLVLGRCQLIKQFSSAGARYTNANDASAGFHQLVAGVLAKAWAGGSGGNGQAVPPDISALRDQAAKGCGQKLATYPADAPITFNYQGLDLWIVGSCNGFQTAKVGQAALTTPTTEMLDQTVYTADGAPVLQLGRDSDDPAAAPSGAYSYKDRVNLVDLMPVADRACALIVARDQLADRLAEGQCQRRIDCKLEWKMLDNCKPGAKMSWLMALGGQDCAPGYSNSAVDSCLDALWNTPCSDTVGMTSLPACRETSLCTAH